MSIRPVGHRKPARKPNATQVMLGVLVYEFPRCDRKESDATIRRRLRYYRLPKPAPSRLQLLRRLKDELQQEINLATKSRYYLGPHGEKSPDGRHYANGKDFDIERLTVDTKTKFPRIAIKEIRAFVPFAILTYYLR